MILPPLLPTLVIGVVTTLASSQLAVSVRVDASQPVGPIGSLYNVGYDGWGDITNAGMVEAFRELGIETCRMEVNLRELCGERPGDYRWNYATPRDVGIGFTDRVRRIVANGWKPLLAFSYHGGGGALPEWFHGEANDADQKAWVRYNQDGALAREAYGDQLEAARTIARDLARHLAAEGLPGLSYETMYEMGHDMPLVEIHHAVALGVREGDSTAVIVGPATWPGWTVEERFVKPYLARYGPDLLDRVSVHWYASNDHDLWKLWDAEPRDFVVTRAHEKYLGFMLERTTLYHDWTRSLHALLNDPQLNPLAKPIGIVFTEIDVNATSYYLRNPANEEWPAYRADRDCWLNTNVYGGVWWASVLGNIASAGVGAGAAKFCTRNYYGLAEMAPGDRAYRYPVWFALRLLEEQGGLHAGRGMVSADVSGGTCVECFATGGPEDLRVVLVNKAFGPQRIKLTVSGLSPGGWEATRYVFDETRVARWLGRRPGAEADGEFEGAPSDGSKSAQCLVPVDTLRCTSTGGAAELTCPELPALSFTVLRVARP